MSRSGYSDDCDGIWLWRGAVERAIKGRRGQAFLREMLQALDALPQKRLITDALEASGEVCAIGAVGKARGIDMAALDPEDQETISKTFGIARALAAEIAWENDEGDFWQKETPEDRFRRMRRWVESSILGPGRTR